MHYLTIIFIAIGLSFDSFAVSVSSGLIKKDILFRHAVRIAFSLAFFQALMPLIGWFAGSGIKESVKSVDHWIAFTLLGLLGIKMIYESLRKEKKPSTKDPLNSYYLLGISLATSIDALVVGFSFAFLDFPIIISVLIIGIITFIISMLGILAGKKTGSQFGRKMEILGGIILIATGLKILLEHLYQ
ncbi:MAG: manganese efflux pump MntP family protein [Bacteroidia bacterium]|nr:manganese efflux pump MntP family protein [Bacteroidia bacterium]